MAESVMMVIGETWQDPTKVLLKKRRTLAVHFIRNTFMHFSSQTIMWQQLNKKKNTQMQVKNLSSEC